MPEHLHGILILGQSEADLKPPRVATPDQPGNNRYQNIGKGSLHAVLGSYKAVVTKQANRLGLDHGWQTRYHDHIIRNPDEYTAVSTTTSSTTLKTIRGRGYCKSRACPRSTNGG